MPEVKVRDNRIHAGDKEISLLSGEVHYWRHNPDCWETIIDRVKELGLEAVCTYVPWHYHEYKEGVYDFEGKTNPQRNLVKYLDLLKSKKLWLIIRPGPYLYTEWVNKGVPDYLVQYHRNHKEFKKLSEGYIRRVCEVIRPYLASSGGNIIMVQADNEVDIWSRLYEKDMGFLNEPGEFQVYLEKKYKSVSELNTCWGTKYKKISEAKPAAANIIEDCHYKKRFLDFCEFRLWFCVEVFKWAGEEFRKNGIDVPISMNAYPSHDIQPWREIHKHCDIFGVDLYPVREFSSGPYEQRWTMDRMKYMHTFAAVPYLGEFEVGVWPGAHYNLGVLPPNHYRLTNLTALQCGIAGWNWYMLANRDNWYFCPINEWGRKRMELFPVFQDLVKWYKMIEPADCKRLTDTAVTFYLLQECSWDVKPENNVIQTLYESDIDYDFFDVETGSLNRKVVFYANKQYMSRKAQKNLLDYVENGGNLVFFHDFPRQDDNFQPLNLLGVKEPDKILEAHYVDIKLGKETATANSPMFVYDTVPGEKITAKVTATDKPSLEEEMSFENLANGQEYTIGYREKRGKGSIVVVGVKPTQTLVTALHAYLGAEIYARSLAQGVTCALLKRKDGKYFIIATNNTNEQKYSRILLSEKVFGAKKWNAKNLLTGEEFTFTAEQGLAVPVGRKDGTIIEISSKDNG
ncbi:MAG: beta-galactosidase [Elusimicrobiota bacterium]